MLQTFVRKLKKIYQVGPRECMRIVANRAMIKRFAQRHAYVAREKKAATTWDVFTKTHPDFIFKNKFLFLDSLTEHVDQKDVLACANNVLHNNIVLFEQEILFEGDNRWHIDFLLKKEGGVDCSFDPEAYFADIKIAAGKTHERAKDIRVVWELSRLHVLMTLGKAYALTHNKEYAEYFQALIIDWCNQNPYLLGVNWVCPMEVGIRAINLIVGYFYFKDAEIDQIFWQKYVCLLYDHMRYLKHTWEYYDGRTSNHYLSDLVGYFYLTYFFKSLYGTQKKSDWVIKEILRECDKQILADGMSYEGSTAYHVLVTELFSLFKLLCEQESIHLPQVFHQKFERMCYAIKICKINDHEMIIIGDNDSGKVLWPGFSVDCVKKTHTKMPQERTNFKQFGLTIVKKEGWQLSLRQHSYVPKQPSGHFHNDVGSVTLALNDVPILIDPGSYCYTASAFWRNYFRSASVHNAASIKGKEPVPFDEKLFALNLPEVDSDTIRSVEMTGVINSIYEYNGLKFERAIKVQKNVVEIKDLVLRSSGGNEGFSLFFNFTFASNIVLEKVEGGWLILHKKKPICLFESDLNFELTSGWVSHNYGGKKQTFRLCAETAFKENGEYICCFSLLNSVL